VRIPVRSLVAVTATALLVGCSSSSHHGSGSPSSLRGALDQIVANDNTRAWVEYGRPTALLAANGGSATHTPYGGAAGFGESDLADYARLLPPLVGFDPTKADVAVSVGQPPTHAGWLVGGVDAGQVEQALTKLGAKKDGAALRLAPDNQLDLDSPLSQKLQAPIAILNLVAANGSSLRYGSGTAALDLVRASKGTTLGRDKTVVAVAECLGDPLAAVLTDRPAGSSGPTREIGIGVTGTSATDAVEELCVATDSSGAAKAMKTRLQTALTSGRSLAHNEQWSQLLPGAAVNVRPGDVVRLTAHPTQDDSAATLFQALTTQDLTTLIGG
jgi:hypothetical protein